MEVLCENFPGEGTLHGLSLARAWPQSLLAWHLVPLPQLSPLCPHRGDGHILALCAAAGFL